MGIFTKVEIFANWIKFEIVRERVSLSLSYYALVKVS